MSLNQLSMLLGLPDSDLKQVLEYASTLSKAEAADHFKDLLGDSPQAIDFISSFNSRRQDPKPKHAPTTTSQQGGTSDIEAAVPKHQRQPKKNKKAPLHAPAPRQIADTAPTPGTVYSKKATEDDYIAGHHHHHSGASTPSTSNAASRAPTPRSSTPAPQKSGTTTSKSKSKSKSKPPPSAAGSLVSDLLSAPKQKNNNNNARPNATSRSSTPGPAAAPKKSGTGGGGAQATKVSITGGTPMHGASTAVADLDAAIRALEVTTNPSLSGLRPEEEGTAAAGARRRCGCVATRHPLQTAAPNCLRCGKVVCVREGLGPCTFCGAPLLGPDEVQGMIRELRLERGRERQAADREAHRRADVAAAPRAFTRARTGYEHEDDEGEDHHHHRGSNVSAAEERALEHRDKLLGFQAQNARRTTVRDEAADFDVVPTGGASMWASPEERARELRRQQKLLREMEWSARPEYEKRQQVVSIDIVGGKVRTTKKFVARGRPLTPEERDGDGDDDDGDYYGQDAGGAVVKEADANGRSGGGGGGGGGGGRFSRNPLLGAMIKPVYDAKGDAKGKGVPLEGRKDRAARWRRVQDDLDDNEAVILDGGVYRGQQGANTGSAGGGGDDEPECG